MTKTINYSKTIIYKLVCNDLNITDVYVGHTTNFLKRRTSHKNKCNDVKCKGYNFKVYQMIRQNGGWVNWSMVEIEKFPCSDKNEAVKKERYYYELLNSSLNSISPNQTKEDIKERSKIYYEDNKEVINQRKKKYEADNKEVIRQRKKIYYEDNKEHIKQYSKKYNKDNKDYFKKYCLTYYKDNKDYYKKYNEKNKEVIRQQYKIRYMRRKIKKLVVSLYYLIKKNNVILNGIK
jgi:hypothetical protein